MSFAWPKLFFLLVVPLALLVWEFSRRRRLEANTHPKMLRAEAEFHRLALVAKHSGARRARIWLCLGLALGVVALARPQWGRIDEQVFDQSREILLAIDLSRSMQSQDVKPSRLDRAKLLIQSLLERLEGERVGLIVFSGTAFLQSPLSADYEILREFLPALGPDYLPEGGTNYRALIDTALQAFSSSSAADRFLIVLSDGEATDDDWKEKIEELTKRGIRVIGLGVGTTSGAMIPDGSGSFVKDERGAVVLSRLESGTLQQLTKATSGTYRDASTWLDLAGLIKETVETGRKGNFVEKNQVRLVERFQWALAPALLCLLMSFWREFPVLPKPRQLDLGAGAGGKQPESGSQRTKTERPATGEPPILTPPSAVVRSLLFFALLASGFWPLVSYPLRAAAVKAPSLSSPAATANAPAATAVAPGPNAAEAIVAPLSNLTKELAESDHVPAGDWNRFVTTTLEYAQRRTRAQEPVSPKAINDGLDACDAGQALDPKAADWDSLRRQLRQYQDPKDDQKQQQDQKKDQQKQDQQKQDQEKQDQDQQKQDQEKQKQDQQQKSDQQKKQDDKSSKQDEPSDEQKKQDEQNKKDQQSAFGDMKDQPPTPPPPSNETQKVGGAPEKKEGQPKDADPSLALPLQKLDQLKNQDSPAKLYQLMDGEKKSDSKKKGKDW